jgi:hypothetical protein
MQTSVGVSWARAVGSCLSVCAGACFGSPANQSYTLGHGSGTGRAWIGSIDISINRCSWRAFDTKTAVFASNSQPGQQFFGTHGSNYCGS